MSVVAASIRSTDSVHDDCMSPNASLLQSFLLTPSRTPRPAHHQSHQVEKSKYSRFSRISRQICLGQYDAESNDDDDVESNNNDENYYDYGENNSDDDDDDDLESFYEYEYEDDDDMRICVPSAPKHPQACWAN